MNENRIKFAQIINIGSLTSDANGNLSIYNPFGVINGEIIKVHFRAGDMTGGSIALSISGTGEDIIIGTNPSVSATAYLGTYVYNNGVIVGSPFSAVHPVLNNGDVLFLWGSGLGINKSASGIMIYYR